ncbi:hypothetical protein D3874_15345 [Oleomonas cavernae]|uniref:Uncharacterized protein n=1 Tax=Oleomonas cavernae TaxID=2320859 RepID=A0A418WDZ9_9PROT|nr:hypothetical protein [Oleomonas cavernae]RJF88220.1 hypothetical protein D3874_15345 [Oleomonas cavernae]
MSERARWDFAPDQAPTLSSTLQQIEFMRSEIQSSVLDTMIVANRKFIDQQLKQADFVLANEIACVLKEGLSLTAQIVGQLKQSGTSPSFK